MRRWTALTLLLLASLPLRAEDEPPPAPTACDEAARFVAEKTKALRDLDGSTFFQSMAPSIHSYLGGIDKILADPSFEILGATSSLSGCVTDDEGTNFEWMLTLRIRRGGFPEASRRRIRCKARLVDTEQGVSLKLVEAGPSE